MNTQTRLNILNKLKRLQRALISYKDETGNELEMRIVWGGSSDLPYNLQDINEWVITMSMEDPVGNFKWYMDISNTLWKQVYKYE